MAKVGNAPFMDLLLQYLGKQGFREVILCTGYQADAVEEYYRKNQFGLTIRFSREHEPLGTGGALRQAKGLIKEAIFFALNGDSFCPVDFTALLDFHLAKKAAASLVVAPVQKTTDYGRIQIDAQKRITAFEEKKIQPANSKKPSVIYASAGIYCFKKTIFDLMPGEKFSLEKDFFPQLTGQGLFGFESKDAFYDIGTPERYKSASAALKKFIKA